MKMFSAIILSGALLTAAVSAATGYSFRSRATAGFDSTIASAQLSTLPKFMTYPGVAGGIVYRAEQCGGDYVCDEYGAWMAIGVHD